MSVSYTHLDVYKRQVPTCDTPEIIRYVTDKAKDCPVQVLQAGSVTKGLKGQELTDFDALLEAGAPCLTDDGINLTSAALCRTAMAEAAKPVSYTHLAGLGDAGVPAKTPYPGQWMAVRCREYCSIMGLMFTGRW